MDSFPNDTSTRYTGTSRKPIFIESSISYLNRKTYFKNYYHYVKKFTEAANDQNSRSLEHFAQLLDQSPTSFPLLHNIIIKLSRKYIISFVLKIKLTFACLLNYVAFDSNQISGFEDLKIPALF